LPSFVAFTGPQRAAALEFVSDGSEDDDLASGGVRLLGAEPVLAQFGKTPGDGFLCRASSAVEPLGALIAGKLGDIEFEGGRGG
jgi:hypothetical protein